MAKIKSAIKRIKTSEKRRERNVAVKSAVKTAFRKAEGAIKRKAEDTLIRVKEAIKAMDKAVSKGIIHKGSAARKKSRLMAKYNASQKTV